MKLDVHPLRVLIKALSLYDEYRQFMFTWLEENKRIFWDYWNALPPDNFSDTHFHRNPIGEKHFAQILTPEIQTLICQ